VSLFSGVSGIGFLTSTEATILREISDPFFATCAHAISTVAKQHSYSVVLATSDENPAAEFDEASRMGSTEY
jgi:LacI family transcriptional regulator